MRFVKTVSYFNDLPTPEKLVKSFLKPFMPLQQDVRTQSWCTDLHANQLACIDSPGVEVGGRAARVCKRGALAARSHPGINRV